MGTIGRIGIALGGAALYATSFALPTFHIFDPTDPEIGFGAFLVGWQTWRESTFLKTSTWSEPVWVMVAVAWLANPAVLIAILAIGCGRWRLASLAAGCAIGLCLVFLPAILPQAHYPGYWVWLGSAVFLWGASVFAIRRARRVGRAP